MKKLTAIIIIFIVFVIITLVFVFFPPNNILENIPFINTLYTNSTLTINSPNSKSEVFIDGTSYGQTNQTINDLSEGTYTITLKRVTDATSSTQLFYNDAVFVVELTNNTESIINMEIGPSSLLSGYILYYSDSPSALGDQGYFTVSSLPENSSVYLDDQFLAKTPILMQKINAGNYTIRIECQGYESIEVPIIIRSDYNLNVNTYLFPIPTDLEL